MNLSTCLRLPLLGLAAAWALASGASAQAIYGLNDFRDLPDYDLSDGQIDADVALPGEQRTLRAALMQTCAWGGDYQILMPSGVYALDRWGTDDVAKWGDLDFHGNIGTYLIQGTGPGTVIDAQALAQQGAPDRVFDLPAATLSPLANVTIQDMRIRNGTVVGVGGGVRHEVGALTLFMARIDDCTSEQGGGVHTKGVLAAQGSVIVGCQAFSSGGLIGSGGGIYAAAGATVQLVFGNLASNQCGQTGGGIRVQAGATLQALGTDFSGNTAGSGGGASIAGTADLQDCGFTLNQASGSGGGVSIAVGGAATLLRTGCSDNVAQSGGGLAAAASSTLSALECAFDQNVASLLGGGLSLSGSAELRSSTISRNIAASGGGVHDFGELHALNCTFSQNFAGADGGGLYMNGLGTVTSSLSACTVVQNSSVGLGAGIRVDDVFGLPVLQVTGVLLAENLDLNGLPAGFFGNPNPLSLGFNLDADGTAGLSGCDEIGGHSPAVLNALLGPLQHNGGQTETHELLPGSPALGRGASLDVQGNPIVEDQRGTPRGAPPDIGAYEAPHPPVGLPTAYCLPKPTTIPGCLALMTFSGKPRFTTPACLVITAGPAPGGNVGVFFWGLSGPSMTPFQGGLMCVAPPVTRSGLKVSGGSTGNCNGAYTLSGADLGPGSWLLGKRLNVQCWFRDPGGLFNSSLSDALEFTVY